jgi:hypothetical protein
MKIAFVVLALSMWGGAAHARTVSCGDFSEGGDGTYAATFRNVPSGQVKVSLFVPFGESSGKFFQGTCEPSLGAGFAVSCEVQGDEGAQFIVNLSESGGKYIATARELPSEKPQVLSCE